MSENKYTAETEGSRFPNVELPPALAEHVRQVVREDIVSGRLKPGERVTEAALMRRTGVSRTPVREGMRLLQFEGLVAFQRGRGSYVAHRLSRQEALLIYELRLQLEPYLTGLAVQRMTPPTLQHIRSLLDRFGIAAEGKVSPLELASIDSEFHGSIYDAAQSDLVNVFRSYWSKLQSQLSAHVFAIEKPGYFYEEHHAIVRAVESGEVDLAKEAMTDHIAHGQRILRESFPGSDE